MSRFVNGGLLLLLGAMIVVSAPVVAGDHDVEITGEGHVRMELLEDFDDFNSDSGKSIDFTTYLVRFGLGYDISDNVRAFAQFQAQGLWGDVAFRSAQDPAFGGTGQAPFDNDNILMYQAYVDLKELGDSPVSLRIGRQEHVLGNELHMGDNDFYNGRFFDGVRAMIDLDSVDLDVFYYNVEERDLTAGFGGIPGSNDKTLGGVTANFEVGEGQIIEPYVLHYRDGFPTGQAEASFYTVGALYHRPVSEDSPFDWSVEAALQSGDISGPSCPGTSPCDLSSNVVEGWFGYSFGDDQKHRVHVGTLMLGDGDDTEDVEFFMEIAPDTHRRAGALDLFSSSSSSAAGLALGSDTFHNLSTYYLGYGYNSGAHGFSATYHDFSLSEDFGAPEDALGQEIDLIYNFQHSDRVGIEVGVAQFMPDDLFLAPNDDDPMRIWAMLRLNK